MEARGVDNTYSMLDLDDSDEWLVGVNKKVDDRNIDFQKQGMS